MTEAVETLVELPSEVVEQEAQEVVAETEQESPESEDHAPEEMTLEERVQKLSKAKERDSRKIGKLKAELREREAKFEQAIAELAKRFPKEEQQALSEDGFENYGDYLKAEGKMTAEQVAKQIADEKIAAFVKQQETQQLQERWVKDREQAIDAEAEALAKSDLPDYLKVVGPHVKTISELPVHVRMLGLGLPNAALAIYQLATEDAIEDLADMDFNEAKAALEQAVQRAQTNIKARKTTKAPQPMSPVKGQASSAKSLERMSAAELVNWVRGKN